MYYQVECEPGSLHDDFLTDVRRWLSAWGFAETAEAHIFECRDDGPDACVIVLPGQEDPSTRVAYAVEVSTLNLPSNVCEAGAFEISEYLPYADPVEDPDLACAVQEALGVPLLDESNEPIEVA